MPPAPPGSVMQPVICVPQLAFFPVAKSWYGAVTRRSAARSFATYGPKLASLADAPARVASRFETRVLAVGVCCSVPHAVSSAIAARAEVSRVIVVASAVEVGWYTGAARPARMGRA